MKVFELIEALQQEKREVSVVNDLGQPVYGVRMRGRSVPGEPANITEQVMILFDKTAPEET